MIGEKSSLYLKFSSTFVVFNVVVVVVVITCNNSTANLCKSDLSLMEGAPGHKSTDFADLKGWSNEIEYWKCLTSFLEYFAIMLQIWIILHNYMSMIWINDKNTKLILNPMVNLSVDCNIEEDKKEERNDSMNNQVWVNEVDLDRSTKCL